MANIKKGDLVQVISGADPGPRRRPRQAGSRHRGARREEPRHRRGRQLRHQARASVGQTQRGTKTGGIETHEAPIHISNVALVDPKTKKPTRVGFREETVEKNGVKKTVRVRYAKKSGEKL